MKVTSFKPRKLFTHELLKKDTDEWTTAALLQHFLKQLNSLRQEAFCKGQGQELCRAQHLDKLDLMTWTCTSMFRDMRNTAFLELERGGELWKLRAGRA